MTTPYDHATSAETLFHPLADPDRRQLDPIAALVAARDLRTLIGTTEYDAVDWARRAGWTWAQIGEAMGTSKQAAQQRFGAPGYDAPRRPGCAHALDARNCPEVGGPCPDARDALRSA
jgi:hypothetical protein